MLPGIPTGQVIIGGDSVMWYVNIGGEPIIMNFGLQLITTWYIRIERTIFKSLNFDTEDLFL